MPSAKQDNSQPQTKLAEEIGLAGSAPDRVISSRGQNYFHAYVNNVEIGFTPWDIRIKFAEVTGADQNGLRVEELGTVVMAPLHAKAFLAAIASAIHKYEANFGEIPLERVAQLANSIVNDSQ